MYASHATVGVIANPLAGKDIRRLLTAASHTSDVAKVGIVRRVVEAALDAGADEVLVAADTNAIGGRAVEGVPGARLLDIGARGDRTDSVAAARALRDAGVGAVVVLGGDGTCRDVARGWPGLPLVAVSTGTNNVYPHPVDGTSAGWAAGLVASGNVSLDAVSVVTKQIAMQISDEDGVAVDDMALVEVALIDAAATGARAVLEVSRIRTVVAAVARPSTTGLSAVAGRAHPLDDEADGGIVVDLGPGGRTLLVPLTPGRSDTVEVTSVRRLDGGTPTTLRGPGVLAVDGERHRVLGPGDTVLAWIERSGPRRIDVERALTTAASQHLFDLDPAAELDQPDPLDPAERHR